MKTVYLHIGAPKTGTSSIQSFCRENSAALATRGIWFPSLPVERLGMNAQAHSARGHHPIALHLINEKAGNFPPDLFDALLSRFESSSHSSLLVSAETLFQRVRVFAKARIPAALRKFRVVAICYIRRSDEFLESLYKTNVRGLSRYSKPISVFTKRTPEFASRLDTFSKLFQPEVLIVRSYDLAKTDLLNDFFTTVLGYADPGLCELFPTEWHNIALSARQTLFLRLLNEKQLDPMSFKKVCRVFSSLPSDPDNSSLLSPELRQRLIRSYNDDVALLNAQYELNLPVVNEGSSRETLEQLCEADLDMLVEKLKTQLHSKVLSEVVASLRSAQRLEGSQSSKRSLLRAQGARD
jgi:hypothetical protein